MATRPASSRARANVKRADQRYVGRDSPPEDVQVVGSRGSYLQAADGRRYVDFTAGWCVGNLGWDVPEIRARLRRFGGPDYVHPSHLYGPWTDLARQLADITPGRLQRSYRATGGTEAVEIALQLAMAATGRSKFVSIEDSYHGNSLGTMSVGASSYREELPNLLRGCLKIKRPLDAEALDRVERLLRTREVAAFIMEPIICNLGALVPDAEFMRGLPRLCRRYGTLLILDEVATGFGRTGRLFASEIFGLAPDIMTLAKAITGGHAGMGATVATERVARAADGKINVYSTYGWHPLSVEAALANLAYLRAHETQLLKNVADRSEDFRSRLHQMDFGCAVDIRVTGLAIGLELDDADYAGELADRCRRRGLILSADDDTLTLFPALTISSSVLHEGLDILERCL
ncbi:MAG TPA: aspartate aminotransferase family protein [Polyangia bacterium]|nr:aspartate aminotransferase family protein [Polyangia bacterium]